MRSLIVDKIIFDLCKIMMNMMNIDNIPSSSLTSTIVGCPIPPFLSLVHYFGQ